mgnify:FL=1
MPVTQKDIAQRLELSINTVSRALRNMPDVNESTRKQVQAMAEEMGYYKNLAASSLRTRQSNILGVVVTDFRNPSMGDIIHGAELVAKRSGYTLMLGSTNETAEDESRLVENMLSQNVDGLLLIPSMLNEPLLHRIECEQVPYVLAARRYPGHLCNAVCGDDFAGGAAAAQHLLDLGHRSFLYVSGLEHISSARDRRDGFLWQLRQHGLNEHALQTIVCGNGPTDKLISQTIVCDGGRESAQRVTEQWLRSSSGHPSATAIFVFSDYAACGVYAALKAAGLRIPEDVSVVGYDNNEYSSLLTPPLTTVDSHFYQLGQLAMERLIAILRSPGEPPCAQIDMPELVLRESTASPSSAAN